jgi:Carboxypeptidase regulatory-like domain
MVLKTRRFVAVLSLVLAAVLSASGAGAQDAPRPGEVNLPLKEYLSLVETVERIERERSQQAARREAPVAEIVAQRVGVVIQGEETAAVSSEFEVLIQGAPQGPVVLPVAGVPRESEIKADGKSATAALTAGAQAGQALFVAPEPGRFAVKLAGPAPLVGRGISRLVLAAVAAPVASTELDLPADLAWSVPGSIVVDERVEGGRRKVRFTSRRGEGPTLEIRRRGDGSEAEKLLAQSVVMTLVQLGPEGPRRHDVVLYEVSRGGIASFTVDLPPGLAVEKAGTDEGDVVPVVDSRRLTVHRRAQLRGTGYLVLTSTPAAGASFPLDPVLPETEVRARYLALSSSIAADARPLPENDWTRVDLDDLPPMFRDALSALDLSAAWRLTGVPTGLAIAVSPLPAAPVLPSVVRLRETTTLLTVDGTLLHRDRLTLRPSAGLSATLDLVLPPSAILWSAKVDDLPVRPLIRGGGTISIPLGFETGKDSVVEVVAVLDKAIPKGRSELAMTLAQVNAPVQEHRWRLLLPDGNVYRFRAGDLRPAGLPGVSREGARDPWAVLQSTPGVLTDRITVGGNESGQQQSMYVGPGGGSNLRGRIVDDRGSPLPGVTVTLEFNGSAPVVGVTDAKGAFTLVNLPAGSFTLKAELEGFSSLDYPNVQLSTGRTTSLDITMSAGVQDVITVDSPILDERRQHKARKPESPPAYYDFDAFAKEATSLKQGLVGGVKPLNVAIPETGKLLLLTAVLPPEQVGVELEVKSRKR